MPDDYGSTYDGATVLITGGAGFIGSHLAERLLRLGATVRIVDDLSSGYESNVPAGADLRVGSILDEALVRDAIAECRFVFHEAAMVSVPESVERPQECIRVNVEGMTGVLEAARAAGVSRLVFASSAAAYGDNPSLPSREDEAPRCCSPYAASKVTGELLCRTYAHCFDLSTVSLRYFNVFGPRQSPESAYAAVISAFTDALANDRPPTIFGDGKQTRDFVFIDNVVRANLLAGASPRPLAGEVINIGSGRRISLLEVLEQLGRATGKRVEPRFTPERRGDVRHSCAEITRAGEVLGYRPLTGLADGLHALLRAAGARTPARPGPESATTENNPAPDGVRSSTTP